MYFIATGINLVSTKTFGFALYSVSLVVLNLKGASKNLYLHIAARNVINYGNEMHSCTLTELFYVI